MKKKGSTVTGDMLLQVAQGLWSSISIYQNEMELAWSIGWLGQFKKQYGIKQYQFHGEAAQVNPATIEMKMHQIQELASLYHPDDVYNMDETGLYWKLSPDKGLAS